MKICRICKAEKPAAEFYQRNVVCKRCRAVGNSRKNPVPWNANRRERFHGERAWVRDSRLSNYEPVPESGCWLWMGGWSTSGYGKVQSHGGLIDLAHRYFYTYLVGPIPDGMVVCHKCDTPACCNPSHLFIGTIKMNCHDMWEKGRARPYGRISKSGLRVPSEMRKLRELPHLVPTHSAGGE